MPTMRRGTIYINTSNLGYLNLCIYLIKYTGAKLGSIIVLYNATRVTIKPDSYSLEQSAVCH
jgi:hypothetical protein